MPFHYLHEPLEYVRINQNAQYGAPNLVRKYGWIEEKLTGRIYEYYVRFPDGKAAKFKEAELDKVEKGNGKMIILEGNECCFKTTISDKLTKKLGWKYVKGSSFELAQCTQEELFTRFMENALSNTNVVIDRFIYSNLVYADIYQDFMKINKSQQRMIESILEAKEAKVVYLYADIDVLTNRMNERGDEYIGVDRLQDIDDKYNDVMSNTDMKYISVDTGKMTSDEIVDYLASLVQ